MSCENDNSMNERHTASVDDIYELIDEDQADCVTQALKDSDELKDALRELLDCKIHRKLSDLNKWPLCDIKAITLAYINFERELLLSVANEYGLEIKDED